MGQPSCRFVDVVEIDASARCCWCNEWIRSGRVVAHHENGGVWCIQCALGWATNDRVAIAMLRARLTALRKTTRKPVEIRLSASNREAIRRASLQKHGYRRSTLDRS